MRNIATEFEALYYKTDHCVRCGRCTIVCPTYNATKKETMLARGRIRLIREYVEENLSLSSRLKLYNDLCLGCNACLEVCPARIQVGELVGLMKEEIVKHDGLAFTDSVLLKRGLNKPQSFRMLLTLFNTNKRLGLMKLLPKELKDKAELLPDIPRQSFRAQYVDGGYAPKEKKYRVGYFVGCMTNGIYPQVADAVVKVLAYHDCEVIIPQGTVCCGLPHHAYGDKAASAKLARTNIELFQQADVDYIVTDCASCCHALKNYAKYTALSKDLSEQAKEFAGKVYDINQFLVDEAGLRVGTKALPQAAVTYHDSCHLNRNLNVTSQPREILKAIPGLEFKEMPEADWCCGAAGSFSIKHQDVSQKILERKTENIASTGAAYASAGCPACMMQLDYGSRHFAKSYQVKHPIQFLAETI